MKPFVLIYIGCALTFAGVVLSAFAAYRESRQPVALETPNLLANFDPANHTVTIKCWQTYDVPEGFDYEAMKNLTNSVERTMNQPYRAWTAAGEISKRTAGYVKSVNHDSLIR